MSPIDITIVIAFLILTTWVGFVKGKGVKTFKDFAVGAKNFTVPVLVSTTAATIIGGGSTIGKAAEVYKYGIAIGLAMSFQFFADLFLARVVAPRMKGHNTGISLGDMVEPYYGTLGRILISLTGVFRLFTSIAIQVTACGLILKVFLGVSLVQGALLGMAFIVAYTTFGGIRSVIYTDVLQFIFLIVSIPIIGNLLISFFGGYQSFINQLPKTHLSITGSNADPAELVSLALMMMIPMLNINIMHRIFLNKNIDMIKKSLTATALLELPINFFVMIIGLSAFLIFPQIDPKTAFIEVIMNYLPIGIKGIAAVGLIAVVMSTADSVINLNTSLFMNDVYKPFLEKVIKRAPSDKELLRVGKLFNVGASLCALVIALYIKNILDIIKSSVDLWAPIAVIPLYGILFRIYVSQRTFLLSIITGFGALLAWKQGLNSIAPIIPGFFVGLMGNAFVFFGRWWLMDRHDQILQQQKSALVPPPQTSTKKHSPVLIGRFFRNALAPKQLNWAPTTGFAAFVLCVYVAPNFVWTDSAVGNIALTVLKMIGGLMCAGLLIRPYWGKRLMRFFPLFWHTTIAITLPFILLLHALTTGLTLIPLTNLTLGLFMMALLVPWQTYLILFGAGSLLAYGAFQVFFAPVPVADPDAYLQMNFIFSFAALMAFLFSRPKETQAIQSQKTYKAKAGAFAHDVTTPLATLYIKIKNLQKLTKNQDSVQQPLTEMTTILEKITGMKRMALSELAETPSDMLFQSTHRLKDLIDESISSYPTKRKSHLFQVAEIDPAIQLKTNSFSFVAMLQNLYKNALEAIEQAQINTQEQTIKITVTQQTGGLILNIQDHGIGLSEEAIEQATHPFYTTKDTGSGLGLANAVEIIEKSRYQDYTGHLTLTSKPGEGTTVSIVFNA